MPESLGPLTNWQQVGIESRVSAPSRTAVGEDQGEGKVLSALAGRGGAGGGNGAPLVQQRGWRKRRESLTISNGGSAARV